MASRPSPPIVTVLLPVYNGERYLREAVESILTQTLESFELLIVDDGSTDGTEAICRSFNDPRVRVHRYEENAGVVFALNAGIDLISTKYVARMDADDVALPSRLARQVAFLESRPDIAACGCWLVELVDGRLRHAATDRSVSAADRLAARSDLRPLPEDRSAAGTSVSP